MPWTDAQGHIHMFEDKPPGEESAGVDSAPGASEPEAQSNTAAATNTTTPTATAAKTTEAESSTKVYINHDDQRVDPDLPPPDPETAAAMQEQRKKQPFCQWHYIRGRCEKRYFGCPYFHDADLGAREVGVLRHWARAIHCKKGLRCREGGCIYGHHCPDLRGWCKRGGRCTFKSTHDVETAPLVEYGRPPPGPFPRWED